MKRRDVHSNWFMFCGWRTATWIFIGRIKIGLLGPELIVLPSERNGRRKPVLKFRGYRLMAELKR